MNKSIMLLTVAAILLAIAGCITNIRLCNQLSLHADCINGIMVVVERNEKAIIEIKKGE